MQNSLISFASFTALKPNKSYKSSGVPDLGISVTALCPKTNPLSPLNAEKTAS